MSASRDLIPADPATATRLLAWYNGHARSLPWRAAPGSPPPDPYRVWLSEVMLQQTTVVAAAPYFVRFVERWPTVSALAAAPDAEVMAAWAGLGYYARARNLLACARAVAGRGGVFPDDEAGLRALPGLGAYTAAAVAAIAFGRRAVVVDANVERVVARLHAIRTPLPAGRAAIRAATDAITPAERAGDFAQALMDLGTAICTARTPRCLLCPLAEDCAARALGTPEAFPVKAARSPRPERQGRAFWIARGDAVWLARRPGRGMLGGMRALPDDGWHARGDGSGLEPVPGVWRPVGQVGHVFSHFSLVLTVMATELAAAADGGAEPPGAGEWWPRAALDAAGLPSLFAKAARLVLAQDMAGHTGSTVGPQGRTA